MGLSPEEKKKVYEEEKARLEAQEKIEMEKQGAPPVRGLSQILLDYYVMLAYG